MDGNHRAQLSLGIAALIAVVLACAAAVQAAPARHLVANDLSVSASSGSATADGITTVTITANLSNSSTPVDGAAVNFSVDGAASLSSSSQVTAGGGLASVTVTDSTVETVHVTADDGAGVTATVNVDFTAPPPPPPPPPPANTLTLSPSSGSVTTGTPVTITADLSNSGNPVADGATVNFSVGGAASLSAPSAVTSGGQATVTVTDNTAETVTINADDGAGATASTTVTFSAAPPPPPPPPNSLSLSASSGSVTTGTPLTITANLSNSGTPVNGATVNFSVGGAAGLSASSAVTSGGQATVTLTDNTAETVTVSANDGAGVTANTSVTFTAVPPIPPSSPGGPSLSGVPSDFTVEATGKLTPVPYTKPSASDARGNPVPVGCTPGPGASLGLGVTVVICSATDSAGRSTSAAFRITVVDRTPPILTVPGSLVVSSNGAATVPVTRADIAAFLSGASAVDGIDGSVAVTSNAPKTFALGTATVTFRAVDLSGNVATATATVTIVSGAAPTQPVTDRVAPHDVKRVQFEVSDHTVALTWAPSGDKDADHVAVYRSRADGKALSVIGTTKLNRFTNAGLTDGETYRYVIVQYDHAGNRSAGVAVIAVPRAVSLVRPLLGATVRGAPVLLMWVPAPHASYYNVQLFRGKQKVFTSWPTRNRVTLGASWSFGKATVTLRPGQYTWFVWPGFGRYKDRRYGALLGQSTFVVP